ncbi:MAG: hypothetical protein R8M45_04385 [Ghiorsea sp.]
MSDTEISLISTIFARALIGDRNMAAEQLKRTTGGKLIPTLSPKEFDIIFKNLTNDIIKVVKGNRRK